MAKTNPQQLSDIHTGTRAGIHSGVRKAYAGILSEPLPTEHIDLLLALRRRERASHRTD
ncbi:hypothetical protein LOK46_24010 [Methylobacterium sp. NMS14P]|uniref:hypothetical protein n=1 Tax=unclassified Methylobacterium TaxID=2615210 RepID=UPI002359CA41|nr:hypothetical protein [Methylobacterium sp. NMS14P]WCS24175.1 hypothetical protein LOK46_24010 [Methylobacterium sp. NMS14P]